MNKKFLSAILFGALMVTSTGTFVSCKDYDDEIDNLQEQIDKKADLTELSSQVSSMQSAISAAQSEAAKALDAAKKADDSAKIAALEAKLDALETCKCDVDALKAELKETIASTIAEADLEGLKAQVEEQMAVVKELAGGYLTMVSEIDLYYKQDANSDLVLDFSNVIEVDNVFGPNDEIEFTKGTDVPTPTSIIVRVVPTSASLSKDMITLINGKGESIMDQVEVTDVEAYSELLTRGSETGLWKITFQLKDYNKDNFAKIAGTKDKETLYAVAVNDIAATEETVAHSAVSDYGIYLTYTDGKAANELLYKVGGTEIAYIKNRFEESENGTPTKAVEDYIWKGDAAAAIAKNNTNVLAKIAQTAGKDNRQTQPAKNVEVGVPFSVELVANTDKVLPRAFYVTLDESHAVESAPSELNAWKSYGITGLNTLVDKASKLDITIPSASAKGDYVGFRVYAVNYDGTLVDPDGRAFYVYVGGATTAANASVMFKPNAYTNATKLWNSEKATIDITGWAGATKAKLVKIYDKADANKADKNATIGKFQLANFVLSGTGVADHTFGQGTAGQEIAFSIADLTKYTKIAINSAYVNLLVDGVTYVAVIELINGNANNTIVQRVEVEFTKVFPEFPATINPFTNILINSKTLKIYPKNVTNGVATYDIDNVWHGVDQYTTFAQTGVEEGKNPTVTFVKTTVAAETSVTDNEPAFQVAAEIMKVDNAAFETKYPMAVTYDYGYLSSTGKNPDGDKDDTTYLTNWANNDFELVFGNYVYDCSIVWGEKAPVLTYPGVSAVESHILLNDITITDWYKSTTPSLVNLFNGYATAIDVDLLTGAEFDKVNEYYEASIVKDYVIGKDSKNNDVKADVILLTSKVNASQGEDVPTKIKLTITDIYGGTVVKVFDPFTMTFKK